MKSKKLVNFIMKGVSSDSHSCIPPPHEEDLEAFSHAADGTAGTEEEFTSCFTPVIIVVGVAVVVADMLMI